VAGRWLSHIEQELGKAGRDEECRTTYEEPKVGEAAELLK
jgi:hypothetical protein